MNKNLIATNFSSNALAQNGTPNLINNKSLVFLLNSNLLLKLFGSLKNKQISESIVTLILLICTKLIQSPTVYIVI